MAETRSVQYLMSTGLPLKHVLAPDFPQLAEENSTIMLIMTVLMSHSQFPREEVKLDMHGLVFKTSIRHRQDQPGF